jgi:hypothetical protein
VVTVVVVGAPGCGKSAVWLSLAARLGGGAVRLEGEGGRLMPPMPLPLARRRLLTPGRHGVRVARCPAGGAPWPRALRLVDGPGITPTPAPEGEGAEAARLLAECLAAAALVHVVRMPPAAEVDEAVTAFARARRIAVVRVWLAGSGGRRPADALAVRLGGGWPDPGLGRLAARVRRFARTAFAPAAGGGGG